MGGHSSLTMALLLMTLPGLFAIAAAHASDTGGSGADDDTGPPPSPEAVETIGRIQSALKEAGIDGWLFYDFRGSNPIASRILDLPEGAIATRRWLYMVPATGEPIRIVHSIERELLDHLPGKKIVYLAWNELQAAIRQAVKGRKTVAMEYSPNNGIPYISRVDAGTVELVRSPGVRVVSSADLVQTFEAVWSPRQREQHEKAAVALRELVGTAWALIAKNSRSGGTLTERDVQEFLAKGIRAKGMVADHPPIVAIGPNAANPHYAPPEQGSSPIRLNDLVLIDIWAKLREPEAVYADITWMGFVGDRVSGQYTGIWKLVREARDAALEFVKSRMRAGNPPMGWEVDQVARDVIFKAGYGREFIHRTGHSIDEEVHGNGANMDNLETHDERRLKPGTCFSIEPGVYLRGDFGIRSEIDVYLEEKDAVVTGGPPQVEIVLITKWRDTKSNP